MAGGLMWFLAVFGILVAAMVPFWAEARRPPPDRKTAPGTRIALSQGKTHYRWIGPVRGPVAVLVHGLTTPSPVWDALADRLGATGFRVLVYDLYGRGHSDDAPVTQDADHFLRQLEDLLDALEIRGEITLVGYSMGGAIATAYAARHPEALQRLVLVAPCGMGINEAPLDRIMARLPLIGDWLIRAVEPVRLRRTIAEAEPAGSEVPGLFDLQRAQMHRRGFLPAILASRRGGLLTALQEQEHRHIGRQDVPVMAIWGGKDGLVPLSGLGRLAQWNRNARQEVIDEAGHGLPHTHPDEVAGLIRTLLREV